MTYLLLLLTITCFCNINTFDQNIKNSLNNICQPYQYKITNIETARNYDANMFFTTITIENNNKEYKEIELKFNHYIIYRETMCLLSPQYNIKKSTYSYGILFDKEGNEILNMDGDQSILDNEPSNDDKAMCNEIMKKIKGFNFFMGLKYSITTGLV